MWISLLFERGKDGLIRSSAIDALSRSSMFRPTNIANKSTTLLFKE
jgi:hypothetical protein